MNELSPYQKKFYLLVGGFFVLLVLSYQFSFKRMFKEQSEHKKLVAKSVQIANLDFDLRNLSQLNSDLDEKLGGSGNFKGFQENLLHEVGEFCDKNKITLTEFSEPFMGLDNGYQVETIILKVEGKYKALLRLTHHLETSFGGGKISSAQFIKEKNFKTNKEELFLTLYMQKISRNNEVE
jgi:hypothetical protein